MPDPSRTIEGLSPLKQAYLALEKTQARLAAMERAIREPIAIVGMGCRLPGGVETPEAFWDLLSAGRDAITEVPANRWNVVAIYDPDPAAPGKMVTRFGGFVDEVERFDAQFFGISPREAMTLDPQQRLLLEVAYDALEDAGMAADAVSGTDGGVLVGICGIDYSKRITRRDPKLIDAYIGSGNGHSVAAGRLSYFFGLKGPCVAVDTACSSSLVAVHWACQALRSGQCSFALAGGVNLLLDPELSITFSKANMLAPDGRSKAFDAAADGYVRSEGAGMIVLKRLSDAQAAGDRILALIRGSAVNQDGPSGGLTVPNGPSQQDVIRRALAEADLSADDIDYLEAHGTGTALGDPIEMGALGAVFGGRGPESPLWVGSVKTNIGHAEAAAGIAGLMKAVLALGREQIPPHVHFHEPSPRIPWDELPVRVPTELQPWPRSERVRRAGVSAFAFSGTNAHVVVEEAPPQCTPHVPREAACTLHAPREAVRHSESAEYTESTHLLPISAKTDEALAELARRYVAYLKDAPPITDVCFTAATGRAHYRHRLAVVARSADEARTELDAFLRGEPSPEVHTGAAEPDSAKVAFLFSGQGSQYIGMGRQLHQTEPTFRAAMEECEEVLCGLLDRPLREVLYGTKGDSPIFAETKIGTVPTARSPLDQTAYTQPALFTLEYALARLWQSWGIEPWAMIGHSVGEYVAACLAGVFSVADALKLVAARARLIQALPPGGQMAAVAADEARVAEAIREFHGQVSIAALNGPRQVVISGAGDVIERIVADLRAAGVIAQRLRVSHAFHSPLVEPMLDAFRRVAETVAYGRPQLLLISNLTGKPAGDDVAGPDYWCRHVRQPVRFTEGMATVIGEGVDTFLEVGPQATLLGLARRCWEAAAPAGSPHWLASLHPKRPDRQVVLGSLAELYAAGQGVDWKRFAGPLAGRKVVLPRYPFQRQRYWLEPVGLGTSGQSEAPRSVVHPLLGERVHLATGGESAYFESRMSAEQPAYLSDHRIWNTPVFPGTGFLEMAVAAARQLHPQGQVVVEDVVFQRPIALPENQSRIVQLVLTPDGGGHRCELFSRALVSGGAGDSPQWAMHARGRVTAQPVARLSESGIVNDDSPDSESRPTASKRGRSLDDLKARCIDEVPVSRLYERLQRESLHYGPAFRGLVGLWRGRREALGIVELPEPAARTAHEYLLHPALLDTCLHVMAGLMDDEPGGRAPPPFLPVGLGALRWFGPAGPAVWSHAEVFAEGDLRDATGFLANLSLFRTDGQPVAVLEGLRMQRVDRAMLLGLRQEEEDAGWLYEVAWRESPSGSAAIEQGTWLIFADPDGVGQAVAQDLAAGGHRSVTVRVDERYEVVPGPDGQIAEYRIRPDSPEDFSRLLDDVLRPGSEGDSQAPPIRGVVHLWSLGLLDDQESAFAASHRLACGSLLHLVQALAQRSLSPRLWVVTRGAQPVEVSGTLRVPSAPDERETGTSLPSASSAGSGTRSVPDTLGHGTRSVPTTFLAMLAQAPTLGLGRVVAIEHPEFRSVCVDLDSQAEVSAQAAALCAELAGDDPQQQIAYRRSVRHAARLVRSRQPRRPAIAIPDNPFRLQLASMGSLDSLKAVAHPRRAPGPGQVEIEVAAAGLNFRDVLRAMGMMVEYEREVGRQLGLASALESPLGFECAGVVTAVGQGVEGLAAGDEVVAIVLGSLASHVVAPANCVARKPAKCPLSLRERARVRDCRDFAQTALTTGTTERGPSPVSGRGETFSMTEAATIPLAFATAAYGLERLAGLAGISHERVGWDKQTGPLVGLRSQPLRTATCPTVLIHAAAGGVGQAAVQIARAAGAEILATASPSKWDFLRSQGIRHVMNSRTLDFREQTLEATGGHGVDVVLNSLSGEAIAASVAVLARGGCFVEIGRLDIWTPQRMAAERPDVRYFPFDLDEEERRRPGLIHDLLAELMPRFDRGDLQPIEHRVFPVAQAGEALRWLAQTQRVGKVVVAVAPPEIEACGARREIRGDATYLVTGGLGALGLRVAQWLADRGARHLALAGRSGAGTPEQHDALARLRSRGAEVHVISADVSRGQEVEGLIERIRTTLPPLRGVIHAAGIVDDGLLAGQDWSRFERVMRPKVAGAWHLHRLAGDLDFFVLFSSGVGLVGAHGQGNYAAANAALDALARYRRASGLPAVSIAWGPWENLGMTARMAPQDRTRMERIGLVPIGVEEGLDMLGRLLTAAPPHVAAMRVDWPRLAATVGPDPFWADLAGAGPSSRLGRPSVRAELDKAEPGDRESLLVEHVRGEVAAVLGWGSPEQVGPRHKLFDLGMDSLTSVELRNRLETSLGCSLPLTLAFDYPSVESLARFLVEHLGLRPREPAPARVESEESRQRTKRLVEMSDAEVETLLADKLKHWIE